jgi:hypothetical protein
MMFGDFIKSVNPKRELSVYPISEYNLEALKYLVENCEVCNDSSNVNVNLATFNTSLWLDDLLDKYWDKISYVCKSPVFNIMKLEGNKIITRTYETRAYTFKTESDLHKFFEEGKWKKFAIYTISKFADLSKMSSFYVIRYADITEKYEVRDNKLSSILGDDS